MDRFERFVEMVKTRTGSAEIMELGIRPDGRNNSSCMSCGEAVFLSVEKDSMYDAQLRLCGCSEI